MANTQAIIYVATHIESGREYVGLTAQGLHRRWTQHCYHSRTPKTHFHRAINKYGVEAFDVQEIASCINEEASLLERDIIKQRKPIFNQTNGGEFTKGKRVPQEVIDKIKLANTGKKRSAEIVALISAIKKKQYQDNPELRLKCIDNLKKANLMIDREKQKKASAIASKNRIWSAESRAKLSKSKMGRRLPDEAIQRMAESKMKQVECETLSATFDSITNASELTGISISGISKVCLGKRRQVRGLIFKYI